MKKVITTTLIIISFTAGFAAGILLASPKRPLVPDRPYSLTIQGKTTADTLQCRHDDNCEDITDAGVIMPPR